MTEVVEILEVGNGREWSSPDGARHITYYPLKIRRAAGAEEQREWGRRTGSEPPQPGPIEVELFEDGKGNKRMRKGAQQRQGRSPEETASIVRQHSQEMALRVLRFQFPEGPEVGADIRGLLKPWIDFFQADATSGPQGSEAASSPWASSGLGSPDATGKSAENGGFASDKQRKFLERCLKDAGTTGAEAQSVCAYAAASLSRSAISDAIDHLKDPQTAGAACTRLVKAAEQFEANATGTPGDTEGLPTLEEASA